MTVIHIQPAKAPMAKASLDSKRPVLVMRRPGTPSCCFSCGHASCIRQREEMRTPCIECFQVIAAGERYLKYEDGTLAHEQCPERTP